MNIKFQYPSGSTPLDPDEINGLIPPHITTQNQLNEWEAANILEAEIEMFSGKHKNLLTIEFTKLLHKKMFGHTWKWAGTFRNTERNIGVTPFNITSALMNLFDDVAYQLKSQTYSVDEIAYRFHHRLVWIHPFPNGNGRHSRMMTDLMISQEELPRFTWGRRNLVSEGPTRKQYIDALRNADKHDYSALALFVRS